MDNQNQHLHSEQIRTARVLVGFNINVMKVTKRTSSTIHAQYGTATPGSLRPLPYGVTVFFAIFVRSGGEAQPSM